MASKLYGVNATIIIFMFVLYSSDRQRDIQRTAGKRTLQEHERDQKAVQGLEPGNQE